MTDLETLPADTDVVAALVEERRRLDAEVRRVQDRLAAVCVGQTNAWLRQEHEINPVILRPDPRPPGQNYRQWSVYVKYDGDDSESVYFGNKVVWERDGEDRDLAFQAVYATEAEALRGVIAYCRHQLHTWEQRRSEAAQRLQGRRE